MRWMILASELESTVSYTALVNLLLSPFILLYQILYSFFTYAGLIKREPGALGTRRYSNYAKFVFFKLFHVSLHFYLSCIKYEYFGAKLRHFNELDHELHSRLSRSYRPAVQYMDQFDSPFAAVIAKNIAYVAGAIFGILFILSAYDEDVLTVCLCCIFCRVCS